MEFVEEYLKDKWQQLTAFSGKEDIKNHLWDELLYRYTEAHRHYHNLNHLAYIFSLCDQYMNHIKNPAVVGFAIFYHDVVYDTYRQDNEAQSAEIAGAHLQRLKLNASIIDQVKTFILATKAHAIPADFAQKEDLSLFLDFDMAILAEDPPVYKLYSEKIRQEYAKYSNEIYNEGRKMALIKMLDSTLYHTPLFKELREEKAKVNMREEISSL